jgi:hypothetical protein
MQRTVSRVSTAAWMAYKDLRYRQLASPKTLTLTHIHTHMHTHAVIKLNLNVMMPGALALRLS